MNSAADALKILLASIKKALWTLGLHAFLFILFLVFLDFIFGGLVFYKDVFLAEKRNVTVSGNFLKFNDKTYQEVLNQLQTREQGDGEQSQNNVNE